jgi:hypothetical protein
VIDASVAQVMEGDFHCCKEVELLVVGDGMGLQCDGAEGRSGIKGVETQDRMG